MSRRVVLIASLLLVAACSDGEPAATTASAEATASTAVPSTAVPPSTTTDTVGTVEVAPPTMHPPVVAPVFEQQVAIPLGAGDLWSIPVLDAGSLFVSTEAAGSVLLVPVERDLATAGGSVAVPVGGVAVADHKHIVQGGIHYVASSNRDANRLSLTAFEPDGSVISSALVSEETPTNDMLLFGDGERVYVGKFLPGTGHEISVYGPDLVEITRYDVGGRIDTHANGAAALVVDGVVHLVAPDTLAPGENDRYRLIRFGLDGAPVGSSVEILRRPGLSIVSGLVFDDVSGTFLVFYGEDPNGDGSGGDIRMASYDTDWVLLDDVLLVEGSNHRPHAAIDGDDLYVGYDTSDLTAHLIWFTRSG